MVMDYDYGGGGGGGVVVTLLDRILLATVKILENQENTVLRRSTSAECLLARMSS